MDRTCSLCSEVSSFVPSNSVATTSFSKWGPVTWMPDG